jgi:hypothetical protein
VRPLQIFTNVWAHYLRVLFYICKCIHSFVQSKLWRLGHHLQGLDLNSISKAEDMKKLYHFNRFHGILVRIKKKWLSLSCQLFPSLERRFAVFGHRCVMRLSTYIADAPCGQIYQNLVCSVHKHASNVYQELNEVFFFLRRELNYVGVSERG